MTAISPMSGPTATSVVQARPAVSPAASAPDSSSKPTVGTSSAANVPSAIAALSLRQASDGDSDDR